MTATPLDHVVIVLVEPQQVDNVGATLRAMRNMGLTRLRLVRPAPFDWERLPIIAHRTKTLVDATQVFDNLDDALADTVYVIGSTARPRVARRPVLSPREAAQKALARAVDYPVAFLFGREDNGLPNSAIDRCHALLTIPTDLTYASLNLAQAVMVVAYEARLASLQASSLSTDPTTEPATAVETEAMFEKLEAALRAIDFLVSNHTEPTLRALRALILRAEPTAEETALLTAMARAIAKRGGPA